MKSPFFVLNWNIWTNLTDINCHLQKLRFLLDIGHANGKKNV